MATMKRMLRKVWPSMNQGPEIATSGSDPSELDNVVYNSIVDEIREREYPTLLGTTYLDHAGTTPYAKSAIDSWTTELTTNLFGNPHSASAASQLSTRRIDDVRLKVLKFFKASPDDFDVVFVANATAAIKLVVEAFRDHENGFWYGFHADAHTSLVGGKELAERGSLCFRDDKSLEDWIADIQDQNLPSDTLQLLAYPGQSNMTGRKLSIRYCDQIRQRAAESGRRIFTLLDVAGLASTSALDLSNVAASPDFLALSFYKIFGFPDLGALIVRKDSAEILTHKRYFAGGTVDGVAISDGGWHVKKTTVHGSLEEGTLPFHNILALDHAMEVHARLFNSMDQVSKHTRYLAIEARKFLMRTRHSNGQHICEIYSDTNITENGPIVAFNLKGSSGDIISASEVEKLGIVKGIQMRTGGLCNPGGIAHYLNLSSDQIKSNYTAGRRCGGESQLIDGRPTGVIRISFGAMSTRTDLQSFINFIEEYYVDRDILGISKQMKTDIGESAFVVQSLSVFPIKSCAAFQIPADELWEITAKGLAWDRQWCLVHQGTNTALSQKRYPRLALLKPSIDLVERKLKVRYIGERETKSIAIDLDETPPTISSTQTCYENSFKVQNSRVCGDNVPVHIYGSLAVNDFFSSVLGVSCCLARYPSESKHTRNVSIRKPSNSIPSIDIPKPAKLTLSNQSPILIVSASSIDELNRQIQLNAQDKGAADPPMVSASTFRANIVVAPQSPQQTESPYAEDNWTSVSITSTAHSRNQQRNPLDSRHTPSPSDHTTDIADENDDDDDDDDESLTNSIPGSFSHTSSLSRTNSTQSSRNKQRQINLDILGPCQRCQMLSVNQTTAQTQQEPFSTLAKTRRKGDGRVWFGVHAALAAASMVEEGKGAGGEGDDVLWVRVGDVVRPSWGR